MFSHLQHKIFVAEKIQTDLNFYFVSATKHFRKKVAKQRNLTWGHAEAFIGDCSIFHILLLLHKRGFCVPLVEILIKPITRQVKQKVKYVLNVLLWVVFSRYFLRVPP